MNNMNDLQTCLDEIYIDLSKRHWNTIVRAAEISPQVTCRTIGADLPENEENEETSKAEAEATAEAQHSEHANNNTNNNSKKKVAHNAKSTTHSSPQPSGTNLTLHDLENIGRTLVQRELNQEQRKNVRREINEKLLEHQRACTERIAQQQLEIQQKHNALVAEKMRQGQEIMAKAQQQSECELAESELLPQALREQTAGKQKDLIMQGIQCYQHQFRLKHEQVAGFLLYLHRENLLDCEVYTSKLQSLVKKLEKLITGTRNNKYLRIEDLKAAKNVNQDLDALNQELVEALQKMMIQTKAAREQEEQQQRLRAEEKQQQQQQQQIQQQEKQELQKQQQQEAQTVTTLPPTPQSPTEATTASVNLTTPTSKTPQESTATSQISEHVAKGLLERQNFYTHIMNNYHAKVELMKQLLNDASVKQYRMRCKRIVQEPINSIAAVSEQHLRSKFERIYNFICGQPTKAPDNTLVCVNDHPLARDYCLMLVAQDIVKQADVNFSSNELAPFAFASVVVSLWKLLPAFGELFLAYTYKESPLLAPCSLAHQNHQSDVDYLKALGYRFTTKGEPESMKDYLKRQTGIARLYAAVLVTKGRKIDGPEHPFGMEQAWRFVTATVCMEPISQISATLLHEILKTAGAQLLLTYGREFYKLLICIRDEYLPILPEAEMNAPHDRLRELVATTLKNGSIAKPNGMLPEGYW